MSKGSATTTSERSAAGITFPEGAYAPGRMQAARSITNILLVDDEPEICQLLSSLLKRTGASCVFAHSLAQARNALVQGAYDAVFVDVNLPDGLGHELFAEVKATMPQARCIAISAMDNERELALEAGADLFIPKPFSREVVFDSIRSLGFKTTGTP